MKTINNQPQEKLATYADATGAKFEYTSADSFGNKFPLAAWVEPSLNWTAKRYVGDIIPGARFIIRLVLTHGLPSHLPPYKENPRDPGEGWRVPTRKDSCSQPYEGWHSNKWHKYKSAGGIFGNQSLDYRLPASVLPPDWQEVMDKHFKQPREGEEWSEELQQFVAKDDGFSGPAEARELVKKLREELADAQHRIQQLKDSNAEWLEKSKWIQDASVALTRFMGMHRMDIATKLYQESKAEYAKLHIEYGTLKASYDAHMQQSTPTVRPIAEMPDTVPEGCVRLYGTLRFCAFTPNRVDSDTHFLDIRLPAPPDPEAELRKEFEEALKTKYPAASLARETDGSYFSDATSYSWDGFKLAKAGKKGGQP